MRSKRSKGMFIRFAFRCRQDVDARQIPHQTRRSAEDHLGRPVATDSRIRDIASRHGVAWDVPSSKDFIRRSSYAAQAASQVIAGLPRSVESRLTKRRYAISARSRSRNFKASDNKAFAVSEARTGGSGASID
jgi:hypothetical protein